MPAMVIFTSIMMADMTLQPASKQRSDRALDELFRQIIDWGGAITGEHGIGLAKLPWWAHGRLARVTAGCMLRSKKRLIPKHILNPGQVCLNPAGRLRQGSRC